MSACFEMFEAGLSNVKGKGYLLDIYIRNSIDITDFNTFIQEYIPTNFKALYNSKINSVYNGTNKAQFFNQLENYPIMNLSPNPSVDNDFEQKFHDLFGEPHPWQKRTDYSIVSN